MIALLFLWIGIATQEITPPTENDGLANDGLASEQLGVEQAGVEGLPVAPDRVAPDRPLRTGSVPEAARFAPATAPPQQSGGTISSVLFASTNEHPSPPETEDLFAVDPATGAATKVANMGLISPMDMTSDWRPESFRIWATEYETNELIIVDPVSGAATLVGPFNTASPIQSIAYDVQSDSMYGTTTTNMLVRIDTATGAATVIGPVGFGSIFALGFDIDGTLFAISDDANALLSIDPTTGVGSTVATLTLASVTDIAVRPEDGALFASDSLTDAIYTIDKQTGAATLVGPYGANLDFMVGLAFSPTDPASCFAGTVNLGAASFPTSVLRINNQFGGEGRRVVIAVGEAFQLTIDAPPAGPNPAGFALYAWTTPPDSSTISPQPYNLGSMCMPTFLDATAGAPEPFKVWNNIGRRAKLGVPDLPSIAAPSIVADLPNGWPSAFTATVQGFIHDNGSAADGPASITNAIVLEITEP